MALFCDKSSLETESDVEQKLIYAFLTATPPIGLGLNYTQILTKKALRRQQIGKGNDKKLYYPDYLISIRGIPVCVVEAKKPETDLETAFAEARLYAAEINAKFPHQINSCRFIIVSNGYETWAGYSDQAKPVKKLSLDDFNVESQKYTDFLEFCSLDKMTAIANQPYINLRGNAKFNTPVSLLGGKRVQNETIEENSFGRTFVFENRNIFDPETEDERSIIVDNAYITSAKREQHIDPIYKEIRKFEKPGENNTILIPTEQPIELINKISQRIENKDEAYSLMLLVGNAGSGKTTFIRYFKRKFLENKYPDLSKKCDWIFLDMNTAPVNNDQIYIWVTERLLKGFKSNHTTIDFDELDTIEKIFREEITIFKNGIGKLIITDQQLYNTKLFELLSEKIENKPLYLEHIISFLKEYFGSLPIIVLDNCDKRSKDEQLLMFQVSQWLRTTFKCLVLLPMRDTTYDQYRDKPPLDTVVKDLVFRIDSPDLLKVIQSRLDFIVRNTDQEASTFVLKNGTSVSIKKNELTEYFKSILVAIRQNKLAVEIFYKISDRNIRKGIQLFEDFCKSGHIDPNDFLMMRVADKEYELPSYKFLNALLRKNRKFYNGNESNFVNVFDSDYNDDFPDPFVRVDILKWLKTKQDNQDKHSDKMFKISSIIMDLQLVGHKSDIILREIKYLVERELLLSESLSSNLQLDDKVMLTLSGKLHLSLLNTLSYIAACAEDIKFKNSDIMKEISDLLSSKQHLSKVYQYMIAKKAVRYLADYKKEFLNFHHAYLENGIDILTYDINELIRVLEKWENEDKDIKSFRVCSQKYTFGTKVTCQILNIESNYILCQFDDEYKLRGYLNTFDKKHNLSEFTLIQLVGKSVIECDILSFNSQHNSYDLKFVSVIE